MALRTAFTELLSLRHPIALAPMGGVSGGALAAAVSNGGGLGLVGGGRADPAWVAREMEIAAERTARTLAARGSFSTALSGPLAQARGLAGRAA